MVRSSRYPIRAIVSGLIWYQSEVRLVALRWRIGYRAMSRNLEGELVIAVREEPVYRQPRRGLRYDAIPGYNCAIQSSRPAIRPRRIQIPFASSGRQVVFRLSISRKQLLLLTGQ